MAIAPHSQLCTGRGGNRPNAIRRTRYQLNRPIVLRMNRPTDCLRTKGRKEKVQALRLDVQELDIRAFGAVSTRQCGQVRGPVQVAFSRSLDPVLSLDVSITRMAVAGFEKRTHGVTDSAEMSSTELASLEQQVPEDTLRTMGRKSLIPYGLYLGKGFVSAHLAQQTGFNQDDLRLLFEAILAMFEHDRSASKGVMTVRAPIYVFKHVGTDSNAEQRQSQAMLGCAPAQVLFEEVVTVKKRDGINAPRCFRDYEIESPRRRSRRASNCLELPGDLAQL